MARLETDLSKGRVTPMLVRFALPFLLSTFIQFLYGVVDMIVVGQFSGTISISGVNIGGQVTFLLTNLVMGLAMGGNVLVAQLKGAGKRDEIVQTIGTLFSMLMIAAVGLTVLTLALCDPLLRVIQTPVESFAEARSYLEITALGVIFIFGYNALSAIMRGMGDSKSPMIFVAIACGVNIVLDLVFVAGFHMAARGAAIATIISQALSMVLCVVYLLRHDFIFDFKVASFRIVKDKAKQLLTLGLPLSLQNVVTSLSFLILTALVNVIGGVEASAAVGAASKFNNFGIMPAIAMGMAVSSMVAQNYGAGRLDRVKQTLKAGSFIALAITFVMFLICQLVPEPILRVFSDDPGMVAQGAVYLRAFSFDYLIVPFVFCLSNFFIGIGRTRVAMVCSLMSAVLLRAPAAWLLSVPLGLGLAGVGMAAPIASFGSLIVAGWYYLSGKWANGREIV